MFIHVTRFDQNKLILKLTTGTTSYAPVIWTLQSQVRHSSSNVSGRFKLECWDDTIDLRDYIPWFRAAEGSAWDIANTLAQ